jgi:hypothetical protein
MTINERMAMIDRKLNDDKRKEIETKEHELVEIKRCKEEINKLSNRISDLLRFAWYAIDNGIKLNNSGYGGHEGYDTGMFISNGWSHLVGIKNREYLGISKGGAFGYIDFYTNGEDTYGYDICHKKRVEPLLNDMKLFLRRFDELESMLYEYVEKQCK